MATALSKLAPPRLVQAIAHFREHLRTPLYWNAYLLILNQVASAGMGILYWMIAARYYTPEVVGRSSATISTLTFLAALAELSLKGGMARFVPRAGQQARRLILLTYLTNLLVAAVFGLVFFYAGETFQFTTGLKISTSSGPLWLIIAMMIWVVFYVQDGVLIGLRQALWVFLENLLYNASKIALLVAGIWYFYDSGITLSWFLPVPLSVLLVNVLVFWKFIPAHMRNHPEPRAPLSMRQVAKSVTGDHIGSLLSETSTKLLPLMVVNLLGDRANAYFYQAWLVTNTLYLIASNMSASFTVEAASDQQRVISLSRRTLLHMLRLLAPTALGVALFGPWVLRLFGREYASEGAAVMRWLALATLPLMLNIWFLSYSRVMGHIRWVIILQAIQVVLSLGLSYVLLPLMGIGGVGLAWLLTQSILAVIVLARTAPLLFSRAAALPRSAPAEQVRQWRRSDWRFLTGAPWPRRAICIGEDAFLAQSLAVIAPGKVRWMTTRPSPSSPSYLSPDSRPLPNCELAAAASPKPAHMQAAYQNLLPGGAFYSEWNGLRSGGARAIRRRLLRAGFRNVRLYWALPAPERARVWLPCENPDQPARYVARLLLRGEGQPQALLRAVAARLLALALRLGLLPHLSAVAVKPFGDDSSPAVRGTLPIRRDIPAQTRLELLHAGLIEPKEPLAFLVQTGGAQVYNKIIWLVFRAGSSEPAWVLKQPRILEDAVTLQREERTLERLYGLFPPNRNPWAFPVNVFSGEYNGGWVACQSAIRGRPLSTILDSATLPDLFDRLTDFQIALARKTCGDAHARSSAQIIAETLEPLARLPEALLPAPMLRALRQRLEALPDLPVVYAHHDYTTWNICLENDRLGIFDWADMEADALPMMDLVYLFVYMAFQVENAWERRDQVRLYHSLLDPTTRLGGIFQAQLKRYTQALGIPPERIPSLRLLTWTQHVSFMVRSPEMDVIEHTPPDQLSDNEVVAMLKAELEWQALRAQQPSNREESNG